MRQFIVFIFALCVSTFSSAQDCPNTALYFTTQAQLDSFAINYPNCTNHPFLIEVSGSDITNIDALQNLETAHSLSIHDTGISDITGMDSLWSIASLTISNNPQLLAINGFSALRGRPNFILTIDLNDSLIDITGFESFINAEKIAIGANSLLKTIDAFANMEYLDNLTMGVNPELESLVGFDQLTTLGSINIWDCLRLTDFPSFNNVTGTIRSFNLHSTGIKSLNILNNVNAVTTTEVLNCDSLISFDSYNSLDSMGSFVIAYCDALKEVHGFNTLETATQFIALYGNDSIEIVTCFPLLENCDDLTIIDSPFLDSISGFSNLKNSRKFQIQATGMTQLDFSSNLQIVNDLQIIDNPLLTNIDGLNAVEIDSLTDLEIIANGMLSECNTNFLCAVVSDSVVLENVTIEYNGPLCSDIPTIQISCNASLCPTEDVVINSQAEADLFLQLYPNCKILEQNLSIVGSNVSDLSPFDNLEFVNSLTIEGCDSLKLIDNFNNLIHVNGFIYIDDNNQLLNIVGFNQLDTTESVEIRFNDNLEIIDGFNSLRLINLSFNIDDNDELVTIAGFENLEETYVFYIYRNEKLSSIAEFPKLTEAGVWSISLNPSITSLNGFNALENVEFSVDVIVMDNLIDINGFENLEIAQIGIFGNPKLESINSFHNLNSSKSISFRNNQALESIVAFENLNNLTTDPNGESFDIQASPLLKIIPNFDNVQSVNGKILIKDTGLESLDIFNNIPSANNIFILDNPELNELLGFSSVAAFDSLGVTNNPNLETCNSDFLCNVSNDPELISKSLLSDNGSVCNDFITISENCISTGNGIDLELSLTQSTPAPDQWSTFSITATLTNTGSETATGISVAIPMIPGVVYVGGNEFNASQGNFSIYGDQVWTVGTLAPGATATISINYFLLAADVPPSYAQVLTANEMDVDSTPGNGTPPSVNEDDEASTDDDPIVVLFSDLTLSPLPTPDSLFAGDMFLIQIGLTNQGDTTVPSTYSISSYLSTDSELTADDITLQSYVSNYLDIGTIGFGIGNNVIPTSTTSGEYFIIVKVDSEDEIVESNELNNILTYDLVITNLDDDDDDDNPGGDSLGCDTFYTLVDNTLTISGPGLSSPHLIVKLFSPNWSTIFNCVDQCLNPIVIKNLTQAGTYHIEITTLDENWNQTCYLLEPIIIDGSQTRSIVETSKLHLYPNPTSDYLNIKISNLEKEDRIIVTNALGQAMDNFEFGLFEEGLMEIRVENYPAGMYVVSLQPAKGKIISKVFFVEED